MRMFPILAAWMVACGVEYPAPVVTRVMPDRGWNGEDTVVAIEGSNFYPRVWVEAGGRDKSRLDDDFVAWLVADDGTEHELATNLVAYDELEAVVRAGLRPGSYDVVVASPSGERGRLADGYTVSDTVAAAIELRTETGVSATVQTPLSVDVLLVDNQGEEVAEAGLAVRFWLTDVAGERVAPTELQASGMFAVDEPSTPGGDLTAVLASSGNRLTVIMDDAGFYDLHAAPQRDASIAQATEGLEWVPAEVAPLRITLPANPFVARSGVPFEVGLAWYDIHGNPSSQHRAPVVLQDDCGGELLYDSQAEDPWTGSTKVQVVIRNLCAGPTFIRNNRDGGESTAFSMVPGPPVSIQVLAPIGPVVAGVPFTRNVFVLDSEGNGTDFSGTVSLDATTGGLIDDSCDPVPGGLPGEFSCTATPTVAGAGVQLTAVGLPGGVTGISGAFDVLANVGAIASLQVSAAGSAEAGTPVEVWAVPVDDWGNSVPASAFPAEADWRIADELDEASCVYRGAAPSGEVRFECTLYTAREGLVTVDLLPAGVGGDVPVTVENGPLSSVTVTAEGPNAATPTVVVAGESVAIEVTGWDAWGNPTTVLADPTVVVEDDKGSMAGTSGDLDGTGRLQLLEPFTVAGTTTVRVSQAGFELGASSAITVLPAPTNELEVTLVDAPWAWVGELVDVRVEAVDAYGNRTGWSGTVDLVSRLTATPPGQLSVTNGVGSATWAWAGPALDEVLEASSGSWTGVSATLDVASTCGGAGPTAAISFSGFPEAVACVDPGTGLALASASMAGSMQGANPLTRFDVAVEGSAVVRSSVPAMTVELPGTGVHAIRVLAMDAAGCGHEVSAVGFAGPDDGEPVGPIRLVSAAPSLVAGVDTSAIDLLDVTDCSRDLAYGASVLVRTTLGQVTGVTPSGSGLSVLTDSGGDARVTLDARSVGTGGTAEIHAWVPSGAARGLLDLPITGDDLRPVVWSQDPLGDTLGTVDTIRVRFSEPMLPATLVASAFDLTGPSQASVNQVVIDPDGAGVQLRVNPTVDALDGTWQVTLMDTLRDLAGNRLSGDWSGQAAPYVGAFGDLQASVDPVSCLSVTPIERVIRPDGDDGAGTEADQFEVDLLAVVAPAWWEVSVLDGVSGAIVARTREVPLGGSDIVVWDGRDQAGTVVPNGLYDVVVVPYDGLGNQGGVCQVDVLVDNARGDVP